MVIGNVYIFWIIIKEDISMELDSFNNDRFEDTDDDDISFN